MKKISLMIIILILALGAAAGLVWAGNSPNIAVDWQVLAGGGRSAMSSNNLSLNGTLGQPITGSSTSGDVVLKAGYWSKALRLHIYYLPIIGR
ncbi:MAG: hypothetical protein HY835_11735 [Anaerolineae bacterium]|nr:hypothetical protein [Anaerolineae bacterium]